MYYYLFGSFLMSFCIGVLILPRILLVSHKIGLFDIPDERKVHTSPVPRLGGLSFFPVFLMTTLFSMALRILFVGELPHSFTNEQIVQLLFTLVGCMGLFLCGVKDDLVGVSYRHKFVIQVLAACLFPLSGLWINHLDGLFGMYELTAWVGMPLTVFIVVYITNSINLIDGIDGLASGLTSISLSVLVILLIILDMPVYAILAVAMLGILVPFWTYNVFGNPEKQKKLFMGDTGSLTLGYVLSFLFMSVFKYADSSNSFHGLNMVVFSTAIIPIFDIIRVVFNRVIEGRNPFLPDKNHIHHKLLRTGIGMHSVLIVLLSLSLFFVFMNVYLGSFLPPTTVMFFDVLTWVLFQLLLSVIIYRKETKKHEQWHKTFN